MPFTVSTSRFQTLENMVILIFIRTVEIYASVLSKRFSVLSENLET